MRAVFGLLLIMLGLAMAVVWMPENEGQRQLAVVTDIATQGIVRREPGDRGGRTFSPNAPLLATVEQPGARVPQHTAAAARIVTPGSEAATQVAATSTSTVVTASLPGASVVAPAPAQAQAPAGARQPAAPEMPRDELVRHLQRELKRVGCYSGDVDGDWGAGSRRAMTMFNERVNATLPVEAPDPVLLSMTKNQTGIVCSRTCPSGQSLTDGGRCVANAILARRKSAESTAVQTASVTPPARETTGDAGTTDAGSAAATTAATAATAAVALSAAPLPGRMSVGAPLDSSTQTAAPPAGTPNSGARRAVRPPPPPTEAAPPPAAAQATRPTRRTQRAARRPVPTYAGPAPRMAAGPPVVVYRQPSRFIMPGVPRRAASGGGRGWTATFFNF